MKTRYIILLCALYLAPLSFSQEPDTTNLDMALSGESVSNLNAEVTAYYEQGGSSIEYVKLFKQHQLKSVYSFTKLF